MLTSHILQELAGRTNAVLYQTYYRIKIAKEKAAKRQADGAEVDEWAEDDAEE